MNYPDDTIAAISTPLGNGGIGIVRLSGPDSLVIVEKVFRPKQNVAVSQFPSHTVHFGHILDPDTEEIVDEVLLTVMRAPRTYTREDVVEINCHGGVVPVRSILELVLKHGARLAELGEFTQRAFLNGRIDLTQAEAVLDIIQSKTEAFLKVSTNQLKGELSLELEAIRSLLMEAYVKIEAVVNFPEEGIDGAQQENELVPILDEAQERVRQLLSTADQGRILKEGIKIVICGKPNVGKSSLLNCLLRQPRAIVSHIEGTTRDTIEETAQIDGIPFQLVDTAGILTPRDLIEEEAIRRSRMQMAAADLILFILDGSQSLTKEDHDLAQQCRDQTTIAVINKSDLKSLVSETDARSLIPKARVLKVSALEGEGIKELTQGMVQDVVRGETSHAHGLLLTNLRHVQALQDGQSALESAQQHLLQSLSAEFISEEVKRAVASLDRITGRDLDTDLLDQIFSEFCVGK